MVKRWIFFPLIAVTSSILAPVSTAVRTRSPDGKVDAPANSSTRSDVPASRVARLRHGINLSHWFAQSGDYSRAHLESHTTAEDIALIKGVGFDHVRLTLEPAPLFNASEPDKLKAEYLKDLDNALDLILAQGLAVIVDIHPSDEFKKRGFPVLPADWNSLEAAKAFIEYNMTDQNCSAKCLRAGGVKTESTHRSSRSHRGRC